jgi:hypothetical protein
MGMMLHFATLIFVILKSVELITWSWWLVFLPSIISIGTAVLFLTGVAAILLAKD